MKETILIKHFGPLQEVQLSDIPPYVFLIGPSGSGKSTLLKVVALMRWIYKMMCIRSYLYYSGIKTSSFSLDFKKHLRRFRTSVRPENPFSAEIRAARRTEPGENILHLGQAQPDRRYAGKRPFPEKACFLCQ